jgi:anti-sigma regulatory factor (Ser/Thr protein kinase)
MTTPATGSRISTLQRLGGMPLPGPAIPAGPYGGPAGLDGQNGLNGAAGDSAPRPKLRVFPGRADQLGHVRNFVRRVTAGCPATDDAVLLASELASNAVMHTKSGSPGDGHFEVIACCYPRRAYVVVIDEGAATVPESRGTVFPAVTESGHGLGVVDLVATEWSHVGDESGRAVWFVLEWD